MALGRLERRLLTLIVILTLAAAGLYLSAPTQRQAPSLGGDFTLRSAQGPVALADFRGQVVMLSFGYTHCPDVCPTGLANQAAALNRLSPDEQGRVQALFVSVDPERDSPAHLAEYARYFHPRLLGLTGERAEIDAVVNAYGGFYHLTPLPDSDLGYSVDHSTRVYLLDGEGRLQQLLYHNTPPGELAAALRALL